MNLLIISNADSCRSRIAQALLSSFGKGMKVYSAGTMPAAEIHPLVLKLIKETDIEPNTQPPHSIREYTTTKTGTISSYFPVRPMIYAISSGRR